MICCLARNIFYNSHCVTIITMIRHCELHLMCFHCTNTSKAAIWWLLKTLAWAPTSRNLPFSVRQLLENCNILQMCLLSSSDVPLQLHSVQSLCAECIIEWYLPLLNDMSLCFILKFPFLNCALSMFNKPCLSQLCRKHEEQEFGPKCRCDLQRGSENIILSKSSWQAQGKQGSKPGCYSSSNTGQQIQKGKSKSTIQKSDKNPGNKRKQHKKNTDKDTANINLIPEIFYLCLSDLWLW